MKLLIVLLIPVYTFVLFTMLYKGFIWVFKIDEKGENAENYNNNSYSNVNGFYSYLDNIYNLYVI